jgi:D-serine deaminase-like pyridoxal phosphate-dependent protein
VVSTNQSDFVTIDAGLKALYFTPHAPPCKGSCGLPVPGWRYDWFGDEHGRLYFPEGARPALGDVVELILPHCDPTINLHDFIYLCSGDEVIEEIKIDLRGKFF